MNRLRTVLCIDDNLAYVDNLREILEDAGYAVVQAASCASALERAARGFDVALVDVRLPDGDGAVLAVRLREAAPDAQVILMTGYGTLQSAIAAVRTGAWAYLLKPCAPPELLLAIEQSIRHIRLIEEKRELQRRAQIAEKLAAVGTLAAGLSHEIKNPLNAATLQLAVAERRLRNLPAEFQEMLAQPLQLVRDEVMRLNRVLEEFLVFARPGELRPVAVDVKEVLAHVVDLLAPQAESAGLRIERRWGELPAVAGDSGRLQQAVMNLVLNAIQATPPGGFVAVEAALVDGEVRVTIDDSGPGVPEALRGRIFEPFFSTKESGSGLGLALVHSIVEQHGGSIAIEASAAGGARFVILLPPASRKPSGVLREPTARTGEQTGADRA